MMSEESKMATWIMTDIFELWPELWKVHQDRTALKEITEDVSITEDVDITVTQIPPCRWSGFGTELYLLGQYIIYIKRQDNGSIDNPLAFV